MANNEYVNKVQFGDTTIMDISDTTAESNDVIDGEVFYTKSGARSTGTLGDATQSTHGLMSTTDKTKLDNINEMVGATSSANGTGGLVPTPTTTDVDKFLSGDGTWKDGGKPMVILSYGNSTWQDFINAYKDNIIVYCRASANSNPASGSQTRLGFMAYVNDATNPTNVEFQYYRSMSAHSATAMGDEVYVYKLTNSNGGTWTVTTRKASIKEIAVASGSKLGVSWSSDKVTLSNTMTADDMPMSASDNTTAKAAIEAKYTKPSGGIPSTDLAETYLTSHQDISGKADKVTGATSGNFASLDSNGNLTDSGKNASDFTVSVMTGASSSSAGASGLVPQPVVGDRIKFLCGDGTWKISPYMMYGAHYVEGDSNDSVGIWTGTLENLTAYYNGLTVIYVPKVAGASTTTLNLNNIGAITCYTTNTTKLETQYTPNTPILFTYYEGYWRRADNDVNTTTISNLYHHYGNYVADSAIYRYQILFEKSEDKLTPITNASNDTGTSKTMLTNVEFNAFGRIFYYVSATTVEANGSVSAGSLCFAHESFNARYTLNCGTTLTANKNLYLVVTPTTGNMCKIASSSPWAQELPSTNDGNWYILLGRTYSTYQAALYPNHPVYTHNGTKVIELLPGGIDCSQYSPVVAASTTTAGIVKLSNEINVDDGTIAASAKAVKSLYDIVDTKPNTDTQNTAGSTNTSSQIYLIGATSQTGVIQTYSHDTVYVGTDGCIYSNGAKVLTSHQDLSNYMTLDTDQDVSGNKMFRGNLHVSNGTNDETIQFYGRDSNGDTLVDPSGSFQLVNASTSGVYSSPHFAFYEYPATDAGTRMAYFEKYRLPTPTNTITADVTYNILTSKDLVTVAQGGTGQGSYSSTSVTTNGLTMTCRRWGKICSIHVNGNFSKDIASSTTLITAPSGYRPSYLLRIPLRFSSEWKLGSLSSAGVLTTNVSVTKDSSCYVEAVFIS